MFVKITKEFDETWGREVLTTLLPIAIVPLLLEELGKAVNWKALMPPAHNLMVSMRNVELPEETLVMHPLGTLEVSQNVFPLGITLEKIGEQQSSDADRLSVAVVGGGLVKRRDALRRFPPAQFRRLSDAQKLSAPAFQEEVSGLELGVSGRTLAPSSRTSSAAQRSQRTNCRVHGVLRRSRSPMEFA